MLSQTTQRCPIRERRLTELGTSTLVGVNHCGLAAEGVSDGDWSIGDESKPGQKEGRGGMARRSPCLSVYLAQLEVGEQSSLSWTLIFSLYSAASTGRKWHELSLPSSRHHVNYVLSNLNRT